jgi:DNA polymerase-3 subunit delta
MKITNSRAFQKHIEGALPNHFSQVYLIIAKDAYVRKTAADRLMAAILSNRSNGELACRQLQGDGLPLESILNELNSVSLFSKGSVVSIQEAEKLRKPCMEALEEYFLKPNPSVTLILVASELSANMRLYKKAEKAGIILDVAEEKPWEKEKSVAEWIGERFAAEKRSIPYQACHYMVKMMGTEFAFLDQEIEKIICYAGERQNIAIQDINAVCASTNVETVWQLGEAIFKRDATGALRISKALLADGVSFFMLIKQIRHQFETDYQVCGILAEGGAGQEITQRFPYMKGAVLDRHMQMAQNYGMERFRKGLLKIDETEVLAKNSNVDTDLLAEMLMIKLI